MGNNNSQNSRDTIEHKESLEIFDTTQGTQGIQPTGSVIGQGNATEGVRPYITKRPSRYIIYAKITGQTSLGTTCIESEQTKE